MKRLTVTYIFACMLINGCTPFTGYSRSTVPRTYPASTSVPRKPVVHLRCDEQHRCEWYDSNGQRRYEMDR